VVLLDEMEKAHPGVQDVFYQVFDKGRLRDGEGRDIDFRHTVVLMTSNAGAETILRLCADPGTLPDAAALAEAIGPDLQKVFKPAFLSRVTVVPFFPLSDGVMRRIAELQLARVAERIEEHYRARLDYDPALVTAIVRRCKEVQTGARNIDHILTRTLLPELAAEFLSRMGSGEPISRVHVGLEESGALRYEIT
jgi:type VI secretion system protein VasG